MPVGHGGTGGASAGQVRAGGAFIDLTIRDQMAGALDKARARIANIGHLFAKVGGLALGGGVAIATPLAKIAHVFMEFDDSMRFVKASSQAGADQFAALTEEAKRLGRETSYTAREVADLMAELAANRFKPEQILKMTASVMNLARATKTAPARAGEIIGAVLHEANLDASEAVRVADVLTKASLSSAASLDDLGVSMSYVGPVAADAGLKLEDTVAIIANLGNMGIKGSSAGTALRRILGQLAGSGEELKSLFGVDNKDAAGNLRDVVDILEEVHHATEGLPTAERAKKFGEFFGLLGVTSASIISKQSGKIRELRDSLLSAGGTANTVAKEMDSGIGGSWRMLTSAAEGLVIAAGEQLAPALQGTAKLLELVAGAVRPWISDNKELVVTVAAVAGGLVVAGGAMMGFGLTLSLAMTAGGAFLTVLGAIKASIVLLLSPLGLAVAGVAALGYLFVTQTEAGQAWAGTMKQAGQEAFGSLAGTAAKAWEGVSAAFESGDLRGALAIGLAGAELEWTKFERFLTAGWVGVKNDIVDEWNGATTELGLIWDRFQAATVLGFQAMVAPFVAVNEAMVAVWDSTIGQLETPWGKFTTMIGEGFEELIKLDIKIIQELANAVGDAITRTVNIAASILDTLPGGKELGDRLRATLAEAVNVAQLSPDQIIAAAKEGAMKGTPQDERNAEAARKKLAEARAEAADFRRQQMADADAAVNAKVAELDAKVADATEKVRLGKLEAERAAMLAKLAGENSWFGGGRAGKVMAGGGLPTAAQIADSVKGGFLRGNAAQQFGYGDKLANKSLDALNNIAGNTEAMPALLNEMKRMNRIQ